jgi:hypothetical protein
MIIHSHLTSRIAVVPLAGAAIAALATFAAPAYAQKGPESAAQPNYEIFHSHVAWRAPAVIASTSNQSGKTWEIVGEHVKHATDADWLPIILPEDTTMLPPSHDRGDAKLDLSR